MALWGLCANAQSPMSLAEMFARADSVNTRIVAAELKRESTRSAVSVARNVLLPSADLSLSLGYNGNGYITDRDFGNGFVAEIPHFGNNFRLEVSQVIYSGGAVRAGISLAEAGSEMAYFEAEKARDEVRFLIVGSYIELCKISGQLKVIDSSIELARQLETNMQDKYENGIALNTDITRLELLVENLNYTKIQLESVKHNIGQELCNALKIDSIPVLDENIGDAPGNEDWRNSALENSPAIKMSGIAVDIAADKEKIARSERLPRIALFAGEYLDGPILIDIPAIDKNFNHWAVGISIRYNLANLYKSPAKIRQSHLDRKAALADLEISREQTSLAVGTAEADYNNSFSLLETKTRSVALAEESYEQVRYRFEEGLATMTDLLDASSQLLDSQIQEVNAKMNIAYNYFKLKYISGTI